MPRRAVPPPPGGRKRRANAGKRKAPNLPNRARMEGPSRGRKSGGGIDLPKFASEVSRNYARGVAEVGRQLDKHIPSRPAGRHIGGAVRTGPASKEYLRRALGGK